MGHDITAIRPDIDVDEMRRRFRLDDTDDYLPERYDAYCEEMERLLGKATPQPDKSPPDAPAGAKGGSR